MMLTHEELAYHIKESSRLDYLEIQQWLQNNPMYRLATNKEIDNNGIRPLREDKGNFFVCTDILYELEFTGCCTYNECKQQDGYIFNGTDIYIISEDGILTTYKKQEKI